MCNIFVNVSKNQLWSRIEMLAKSKVSVAVMWSYLPALCFADVQFNNLQAGFPEQLYKKIVSIDFLDTLHELYRKKKRGHKKVAHRGLKKVFKAHVSRLKLEKNPPQVPLIDIN